MEELNNMVWISVCACIFLFVVFTRHGVLDRLGKMLLVGMVFFGCLVGASLISMLILLLTGKM